MTAFERAFAVVIGEEGAYVNNSADPGGETKFGVSKRSYPDVNIANLTLDQARTIYKRDFWDKVRGDELPPTLALYVFDAAVNSGPHQAAIWLQQAVGASPDGAIGPATMAAVEAHRGRGAAVLAEYEARRIVFLASLPTWRTFSLGWARRVAALAWHTPEMIDG